ncbi:unnamed protein product [Orchesella dallaii]|uniref:Uncharacterized protein n=1 Tax=Orchesella dallaii TaxID=48710 RepID=A0ABP1RMW8_9HEXA
MEIESYTAAASIFETQNTLIQHYHQSTVEFWWEEKTTTTLNLLHQCILLHCILLNFESAWLRTQIQKKLRKADEKLIRRGIYELVLVGNAKVTLRQRLSPSQLLLIADSTFPKQNSQIYFQTALVERANNDLMSLPETIISGVDTAILKTADPLSRSIVSVFTTAIIIFVDLKENSIFLACFSCHRHTALYKHVPDSIAYPASVKEIPKWSIKSLNTLKKYRENLHSNLNFKMENSKQNCYKINSYQIVPKYEGEACETYEMYFRYINCSNFEDCTYFNVYKLGLSPLTPTEMLLRFGTPQAIPYGQNESDFTFQVLLPKAYFLDTKLSAFLFPFNDFVWISLFVVAIAFLIWLIFVERRNVLDTFLWLFAVLMENDGHMLKMQRFWGKVFLLYWIFGGILLRNFYNSSLYSLMTAEQEREDFPQNINELLNGKYDMPLIAAGSFRIQGLLFLKDYPKIPLKNVEPKIAKMFSNIYHRSTFISGGLNHNSLQDVANGKEIGVSVYFKDPAKCNIALHALHWSKRNDTNYTFTKFAVMCEGDCESNWNTALFGQTKFDRIVPKQRPFFKSVRFWFYGKNRFATSGFQRFFGGFVQSGLHPLSASRYRKLQRIIVIRRLENYNTMGISNGSLFSYVFLRKGIDKSNEERSATVTAFLGTFVNTGAMLGFAAMVLLLEIVTKLLVRAFDRVLAETYQERFSGSVYSATH